MGEIPSQRKFGRHEICIRYTPETRNSKDTLTFAFKNPTCTDKACEEATLYDKFQLDGIIIENMNDIPYCKADQIGPEIVASMTTVAKEVRRCVPRNWPVGVQILAGANKEAMAVALAADLDFIRAGASECLHCLSCRWRWRQMKHD